VYNVASITKHPKYNGKSGAFDVTLVKLATPVSHGPTASVVCLPPAAHILAPNLHGSTISGWQTFDFAK
jgi:hypothetical protein